MSLVRIRLGYTISDQTTTSSIERIYDELNDGSN